MRRGDRGDDRDASKGADQLRNPVSDSLADIDPAADQHGELHRRFVVSGSDVA